MGIPGTNGYAGMIDQHLALIGENNDLLAAIVGALDARPDMLAITDDGPTLVSKDFPYEGAVRAVVRRTATGANQPAAGVPGLLFGTNVNRLGGSVVNKGAAGVTLYLASGALAGSGTVWLSPNGGAWDFKLSDAVWCGNVYAVADSGNVNVAAAEV